MSAELVCWKCGASLQDLPLPLARRATCMGCGAELHVCRQCRHYDTGKAKQCREPMAEEVKDKTRANFCDWFQPRPDAYRPVDSAPGQAARERLEGLFGGAAQTAPAGSARDALDQLFAAPGKPGRDAPDPD